MDMLEQIIEREFDNQDFADFEVLTQGEENEIN